MVLEKDGEYQLDRSCGKWRVLRREKDDRNILQMIKRMKAKRIVYILRRSCLIKHIIEGKAEGRRDVTGRRGRRLRKVLEDL